MSNVIQIRDPQGNAVYPITDASLVIGLQDGPFSEYVLSWDGSSTPVVANIPAGVSVVYGSTTYTGTLAASSSTACKVYLVASTSQVGEYDRYITSHTSSVYSWTPLASTQIQSPVVVDNLTTNDPTKALSAKQGKVLNEEVSQLGQDLTSISEQLPEFTERIEGINKFSKDPGYYEPNGTWRTYFHHTFINVEEGDVIRLYNWQTSEGVSNYEPKTEMTICAFDANGNAITASGQQMGTASSYTVPSGIVKVCVGVNTAINTKACVTLNQETPPAVETPYVAPKSVVITDSTLTDEELPANSKAVGDALALKIDKSDFVVAPKDIKQTPFLEDFRFCEILPHKAFSSVTTIEGKKYIIWNNSTPNWYTIAINIRSYKDLVLISDILPQSVISQFLVVGIDTGETNIEFVAALADSNSSFTQSPNAYVFDNEKMTITLSALRSTYGYRGNIILYIKMPTAYKINWFASGMQLEGYDWMKIGSYAKADLKKELRSDNIRIVMPSTIYTVVGHEMNIYFDGVVQCDDINRYDVDFGMGSMTTVCKLQNERLRIFPDSIKSGIAFTMSIFDKMNHEVIARKSFTVKANADTKFEKKVIFIGDSLTDRCIYPVEICQELGDNKLVSLGTRFDSLSYEGSNGVVTATNFANEGRGGWSARTYTQSASSGGVVNAFWNPSAKDGNGGFDFAYYMSQNNFDSVDCVAIVLGPNDIAGIITGGSTMDGIISSFREMVDSIHSYNSGIKVIVSLPPHSAEPNGFGASGPAYNVCQKELVESLIAEFDGETNVYLAPVFANIDYHNDYPYDDVPISARNPKIVSRQINNVHFSKDSTNPVSQCWGYLKMADAIWYTMVAAFGEN